MTRAPLAVAACAALAVPALAQDTADADRQAIEAVVRTAYVDGVHAKPSAALMRQGFHPDFHMFVLQRDGKLAAVTLDDWAARIEKGAAERKGPPPAVKADFTRVDVAGNAAVVQLQLDRDGKHTFTDFLSLYRFPEGWRIVAKIFQAHP
jgi:putative lumazine-binding protein